MNGTDNGDTSHSMSDHKALGIPSFTVTQTLVNLLAEKGGMFHFSFSSVSSYDKEALRHQIHTIVLSKYSKNFVEPSTLSGGFSPSPIKALYFGDVLRLLDK